MIVITGTFRIPPSMIAVARPVMEAMIRASRNEEGCIEYSYAFDLLDEGLVRVSEKWRDRAALDAHFQAQHMAEWRAQFPALNISDRSLIAHDTDDGYVI